MALDARHCEEMTWALELNGPKGGETAFLELPEIVRAKLAGLSDEDIARGISGRRDAAQSQTFLSRIRELCIGGPVFVAVGP